MNLSNHWLRVRLNLSLYNIRSWSKNYICEKSKESDKFKKIYKENGESKTRKSIEKVSKTQKRDNFK